MPAGIIATKMGEPEKLDPFKVPDPVDESKATMAGQVERVVDKGGPLMTQAETRAKQQMNRRGLVNTSMAVGAGQRALYDVALPIASQDAGHFQELNRMTHGAGLEKGLMTHGEGLQRGTMTHGAELETGLIQERATQDIRRGWAEVAQQTQLNDQTHLQQLERMGVQHENLLASMDREQRFNMEKAVVAGSQEIQKLVIAEIGAINRTQGLTPAQQAGAINQVLQRAQAHVTYLNSLVSSSPQWDPIFDEFPDFEIPGGEAIDFQSVTERAAQEAVQTKRAAPRRRPKTGEIIR